MFGQIYFGEAKGLRAHWGLRNRLIKNPWAAMYAAVGEFFPLLSHGKRDFAPGNVHFRPFIYDIQNDCQV